MTDAMRKRLLERDEKGRSAHKYVLAIDTDVASTIKRVRRQLKEEQAAREAEAAAKQAKKSADAKSACSKERV